MTYDLPTLPVDPTPWMEDALCRVVGPELFFPHEVLCGTRMEERYRYKAEAREICRRCDVQAECLEYALTFDTLHGIWGGLTPNQRTRLRRKQGGKVESA